MSRKACEIAIAMCRDASLIAGWHLDPIAYKGVKAKLEEAARMLCAARDSYSDSSLRDESTAADVQKHLQGLKNASRS